MTRVVSQRELEQIVLTAFYDYAQGGDQRLDVSAVGTLLSGEFSKQRLELALRALSRAELLDASYTMNRPASYSISEEGYKQVERAYFDRLEASEIAQTQDDPLGDMERQLAPAAGRMVTFGDNQAAFEQAISSIEEAEKIVRASNLLDAELRDETIASLGAWTSLIRATKSFAVGAFRYLVWDRLKKVCESAIEDTYRFAMTGLLLALGSLVLGLI